MSFETLGATKAKRMPLLKLKRWPTLKRHLQGKNVLIWSGEWSLYWRSNGSGYTNKRTEAGEYDFADALSRTSHCGPEKQIEFEVTEPEYCI